MGRASARGTVGVPARGVAGSAPASGMVISCLQSDLSRMICLIVGSIWLCCHGRGSEVEAFVSLAQGSVKVMVTAAIVLTAISWALAWGLKVATFVALQKGCEGILMDVGH